jgi:hypothetical protein
MVDRGVCRDVAPSEQGHLPDKHLHDVHGGRVRVAETMQRPPVQKVRVPGFDVHRLTTFQIERHRTRDWHEEVKIDVVVRVQHSHSSGFHDDSQDANLRLIAERRIADTEPGSDWSGVE